MNEYADSWDELDGIVATSAQSRPKAAVLDQWSEIKKLLDEAHSEAQKAVAREERAFAVMDAFLQSEGQCAREAAERYTWLAADYRFKKLAGERCLRQRRCYEQLRAEELELITLLEDKHRRAFRERASQPEMRALCEKLMEVRATRVALKHRSDLPLDVLLSPGADKLGSITRASTAAKSDKPRPRDKAKRTQKYRCWVCKRDGVKRSKHCPDRHTHGKIHDERRNSIEAANSQGLED